MILDIITYPNKILTKKTKRVGAVDAEIKKLIDDMVETLYAKRGAGLAANQVGESKQIIVVDDSRGEGNVKVLINPEIVRKKGSAIMVEGCLSLPGLELEIKRPAKIEVEYYTLIEKDKTRLRSDGASAGPDFSDKIENFEKKRIKANDLLARIICHEIDHLDGKTMLDRLPLLKRLRLKRSLRRNKI